MGEIRVYNDELLFSNKFLERLQNPTDPAIDKCSTSLLQLFIDKYFHRKEELLALTEKSLAEANKFLTQELTDEDLGFLQGKHPSRTFSQTEKYLEWIHSTPYIVFETMEDGKICYEKLPLIKDHKVNGDKHKVIFNDMLIYHISPDKQFGRCSLSTLRDIKKRSIVAGILYEVGCRWQFAYNGGKGPFFDFTIEQLRKKLTFDKMQFTGDDDDLKEISPVKVKCMRVDNLRNVVLRPALEVLKEFFDQGKIDFYLEMNFYLISAKKTGRPPKKNFHFKVIRKDMLSIKSLRKEATEQDLFDEYEEISNLTEISAELKKVIKKPQLLNMIIQQIKEKDAVDNNFSEDVLTKIRDIRTKYAKRGIEQWGNVLIAVLRDDFSLGEKSVKSEKNQDNDNWPDNLDERIKVMMGSPEIKDRAAKERSLSAQEVDLLLSGGFFQICVKNNKLKKGWSDAVDYFFNWLNRLGIRGPLNKESYGNNKQTKPNDGRTTTSSYGQTAAIFLNESAD